MYNLKNPKGQKKFKEHTEHTEKSKIFESTDHLDKLTKKFLNYLDGAIVKCFSKKRSTIKGNNKIVQLHDKRREIKESKIGDSDTELNVIEKQIADEACKQIEEDIKGLNSEKGGYNPSHLWKLKSKIMPKSTKVPTAMIDPQSGKLVTSENELKKHTTDYYKNVLRNREIKEDLNDHKYSKEELCYVRLEETKEIKTPNWTKQNLIDALEGL